MSVSQPVGEQTTPSVSRTVRVGSAAGLHARPAAVVVREAGALDVPVMLARAGGAPVPARSILRVLGLDAGQGEELTVSASGPGAQQAVDRMAGLIAVELDHDVDGPGDGRGDGPDGVPGGGAAREV